MKDRLETYRKEMQQELENILAYWMKYTIDEKNGGFYGKIDNDNNVYEDAPKGSVLNSRILWSFSSAYNLTGKHEYLKIAERAFHYLKDYFIDKEYGGVYWTVDHTGKPLDTKKQVYALSFAVYGLSEYYRASKSHEALQLAIDQYNTIVEHSYNKAHGGYIEAFARDWRELGDLRLSAKDSNEKKSMNTHLHVLEGFANLYRVWPNEILKQQVTELVDIFLDHIIDAETHHVISFFDEAWNPRSNILSYGHDIEAAWLVQEGAEVIHDEALIEKVKQRSVRVTDAATRGLDNDGGLWYEYDGDEKQLIKEKHSWPQAEAMIGFFNAWQITDDRSYFEKSLSSWHFVKNYILNVNQGEWYWGITDDYSFMPGRDKVGLWKCPYHNTRACIEIVQRINTLSIK